MGFFMGSVFAVPSASGRLANQIGRLELAARNVRRWALNWLSRARRSQPLGGSRLDAELRQLPGEMLRRTGARIAVGAGRSRVVAGTASRMAGPGLTRIIRAGQERAFLEPLRLESLHGLANATLRVLRASGMVTIGELQRVPKAALQAEFGDAEGLRVWRSARGLDPSATLGQPQRETIAVDSETLLLTGALRADTGR
jgi:nucleotidyltransferase/DNA polymerase involved in DNA repair